MTDTATRPPGAVVLGDPDDPRFGMLCPRCRDYLGTMHDAEPRPVIRVGDVWQHAACPVPAPPRQRSPWSRRCAIEHDHDKCPGQMTAHGYPILGRLEQPYPCGCPCHAASAPAPLSPLAALEAAADALTAPGATIGRAVALAEAVCRVAALLDPAGMAAHQGSGEAGRLVRRLGRALAPAARLHRDTQEAESRG